MMTSRSLISVSKAKVNECKDQLITSFEITFNFLFSATTEFCGPRRSKIERCQRRQECMTRYRQNDSKY